MADLPKSTCPPAVPPSLLPPASSPSLRLVAATPLEYSHTWHLNGLEWSGPLDLQQYFAREQYLLKRDLTKDAQITAWILTSPELPKTADGGRPILAACETLLAHAYVAVDGELSRILAHGIASVFTRPEHRGKGYASRMMKELGPALDTWQQPAGSNGTFSVLYSDIGRKFYAKDGWRAFPSTHILLAPMTTKKVYDETISQLGLPSVSDLTASDLVSIPIVENLEAELVSNSKQNPGIPHVAIRPDADHFDWHHARENIQSSILDLPAPTVKGALHQPTGTALIWVRVFATKPEEWQLVILRTHIPVETKGNPEDVEAALAALLLRAQLEAGNSRMQAGVEVWSPEPIVISAAQRLRKQGEGKVEIISRDKEHICSLRWAAGDDEGEKVVWLGIEKFAWC